MTLSLRHFSGLNPPPTGNDTMIPRNSHWATDCVADLSAEARCRAYNRYQEHRRERSTLRRIQKRVAQLLAAGAFIVGGQLFAPSELMAQMPDGADVVAGAAVVNTTGNVMDVNASTAQTIINWNEFNVGAGNTANFNLPDVNSSILNRVTSPNMPSTIAGTVNSNGNVFLVNPSGITVSASGAVNTNSFLASTFDIADADFMDGGTLTFYDNNSAASVVNEGTITTAAGGAHLIARNITNSGTLTSNGGNITLSGGGDVILENGVTYVHASVSVLTAGISPTARLINNSGTIRATGAATVNGEVYLVHPNGNLLNDGTIEGSNLVSVEALGAKLSGEITAEAAGGSIKVETIRDIENSDTAAQLTTGSESAMGGDILLQPDQSGNSVPGGGIHITEGLTVESNGGNILLAGPEDGYGGWFPASGGGDRPNGITLNGDVTLSSAGGDITVKGSATKDAASGAGIATTSGNLSIDSGTGRILLHGSSSMNHDGYEATGVSLGGESTTIVSAYSGYDDAIGIYGSTYLAEATSKTGIHLNSDTVIAATGEGGEIDIHGVSGSEENAIDVDFAGGTIQVLGDSGHIAIQAASFNSDVSRLRLGTEVNIGSTAAGLITESASSVSLVTNSIERVDQGQLNFRTSDAIWINVKDSHMDTQWMDFSSDPGQVANKITIGKWNNTHDVTLSSDIAFTDSLIVYGQNISSADNTFRHLGDSSSPGKLRMIARNDVLFNGGEILADGSGPLDVAFHADRSHDSSGRVTVSDGHRTVTNGGMVTIGGGQWTYYLDQSRGPLDAAYGSNAAGTNGIELSGVIDTTSETHDDGSIYVTGSSEADHGVGLVLAHDDSLTITSGSGDVDLRSYKHILSGTDAAADHKLSISSTGGNILLAPRANSAPVGALNVYDSVELRSESGDIRVGTSSWTGPAPVGDSEDARFHSGVLLQSDVDIHSQSGFIRIDGYSAQQATTGTYAIGVGLGRHDSDVSISNESNHLMIIGRGRNSTEGAFSDGVVFNMNDDVHEVTGSTLVQSIWNDNRAFYIQGNAEQAGVPAAGIRFLSENTNLLSHGSSYIDLDATVSNTGIYAFEMTGGNILSGTGGIEIKATSDWSNEDSLGVMSLNNVHLGGKAGTSTPTSTADIYLEINGVERAQEFSINTTGELSIVPDGRRYGGTTSGGPEGVTYGGDGEVLRLTFDLNDGDFLGTGDFAPFNIRNFSELSGLTIGSWSLQTDIEVNHEIDIAGPVTLEGGNVLVNQDITTIRGGDDSEIYFEARENLILKDGVRITTGDDGIGASVDGDITQGAALVTGGENMVELVAEGNVTDTDTGFINSDALHLSGSLVQLDNPKNSVNRLSGEGTILRYINDKALELQEGEDEYSMEVVQEINVATREGDIRVTAPVYVSGEPDSKSPPLEGPSFLRLNAGLESRPGEGDGGNVIVEMTNDPSSSNIRRGDDIPVQIFSGAPDGTTVHASNVVPVEVLNEYGNLKTVMTYPLVTEIQEQYGRDETSLFSPMLTGPLNIIYREFAGGAIPTGADNGNLARDTNTRYDSDGSTQKGMKNTIQRIGSSWFSKLANWAAGEVEVTPVKETEIFATNGETYIRPEDQQVSSSEGEASRQ